MHVSHIHVYLAPCTLRCDLSDLTHLHLHLGCVKSRIVIFYMCIKSTAMMFQKFLFLSIFVRSVKLSSLITELLCVDEGAAILQPFPSI